MWRRVHVSATVAATLPIEAPHMDLVQWDGCMASWLALRAVQRDAPTGMVV
jgi:hypothetical protein